MTHTPPPDAALNWCREVTRVHSHTFYRGSLLYPAGQREAVWAVYAACRAGDDIVDGLPPEQAAPELARWWAQVQAAFAGEEGESDMQRALAWAVARYPVPLPAFAELHAGFQMDLRGAHYRTLDDLLVYCRRVAGVVGFMIAPIGGYRGGDSTLAAALSLAQAMQLTNILRDVGEDLRRGRLYLPAELLNEYGVDVEGLRAGRVTPEYRALLRHLCGLARDGYAHGQTGIPQLAGRARYGVAVASRLYAAILDELAGSDYDNLNRRAVVPGRRKAWLTVQELGRQGTALDLCPINWASRQVVRLRDALP